MKKMNCEKRRGFTLIELLGVLVVLGVIAIIVFPSVTGMIKNSKQKSYEQQKSIITSAARKWGIDNTDLLSEIKEHYVSLDDLIREGYLTNKEVKDPRNDETIEACIVISFSQNYNQYEYTLEEKPCSSIKKNYLIDITKNTVSIGSGLYKINNTEYRYRGGCTLTAASPYTCTDTDPINNYVSINGQKYRIISIDGQGIKIMSEKTLTKSQVFDSGSTVCTGDNCPRNNANNTFCQVTSGTYFGCSVYAAVSGTYTVGSKTGTVTQNSTLYNYLNITGTEAEVINLRNKAQAVDWNIGTVTAESNMDLSTILMQEKAYKANFKIGLINVSDYMEASLDASCQNDSIGLGRMSNTCRNNNWLFDKESLYPWFLNLEANTSAGSYSYMVWRIGTNNGYLDACSANAGNTVRPVGYLSSATTFTSGDGTSSNPWVIE